MSDNLKHDNDDGDRAAESVPVRIVSISCLAAQPQGGVGDTGQVEVVQAQGLNCQEKGSTRLLQFSQWYCISILANPLKLLGFRFVEILFKVFYCMEGELVIVVCN